MKRLAHRSHRMTETLHRALQMIQHVCHETGIPPTGADMARSLGMKWPNEQGYAIVTALEELGYIERVGRANKRVIKIIRLPLDLVPAGFEEGCQAMREDVVAVLRAKHLHSLAREIETLPSPALALADVPQPSPVPIPLFRKGVAKPKPPAKPKKKRNRGRFKGKIKP